MTRSEASPVRPLLTRLTLPSSCTIIIYSAGRSSALYKADLSVARPGLRVSLADVAKPPSVHKAVHAVSASPCQDELQRVVRASGEQPDSGQHPSCQSGKCEIHPYVEAAWAHAAESSSRPSYDLSRVCPNTDSLP